MTYDDLESGKDFGRYLDVDGDGVPYRTYPGTHPDARRLLHARHDQGPLRALQRGRPRLHRQHAAAAAQVRDREVAGAQAAALPGGEAGALRRDLLRLDQPVDAGSARRARRARHPRQRAAGARLPVPGGDRRLRRLAPVGVRDRAEPRRAVEDAARQRGEGESDAAALDPALRRHADHRALHRRPDLAARRGAHGRAAEAASRDEPAHRSPLTANAQ